MSEQREDMTERDDLPGEVPAAADDAAGSVGAEESAAPTGKYGKLLSEEGGVRKLTGMYRNWFLDYASYVILNEPFRTCRTDSSRCSGVFCMP